MAKRTAFGELDTADRRYEKAFLLVEFLDALARLRPETVKRLYDEAAKGDIDKAVQRWCSKLRLDQSWCSECMLFERVVRDNVKYWLSLGKGVPKRLPWAVFGYLPDEIFHALEIADGLPPFYPFMITVDQYVDMARAKVATGSPSDDDVRALIEDVRALTARRREAIEAEIQEVQARIAEATARREELEKQVAVVERETNYWKVRAVIQWGRVAFRIWLRNHR